MRTHSWWILTLMSLSVPISASNSTSITLPRCTNSCMVDSMFITQCVDVRCLCREQGYQQALFQCLYSQCDSPDYGPALLYSMQTCIDTGAEIYMATSSSANIELLNTRELEYLAGRDLPDIPGLHLRQDSVGVEGSSVTSTAWITITATFTESLAFPNSIGITPIPGSTDQAENSLFISDGHGYKLPEIFDNTVTDTITITTTVLGATDTFSSPYSTLEIESNDDGSSASTSMLGINSTISPSKPWLVTTNRTSKRFSPSFAGILLAGAAMLTLDIYINGH
ncbi:hypothetical protein BX600DRAFT_305056 [Xylariales sp. PMI_506]|nr:hypothetical protein BX600DRAFT_305056 [Xylariales sp. PMI_506]